MLDIKFYGDDGHSSLSAPNDNYNDTNAFTSHASAINANSDDDDSGEGERQSLCMLLQSLQQKEDDDDNGDEELTSDELWMFQHDNIIFHLKTYDNNKSNIAKQSVVIDSDESFFSDNNDNSHQFTKIVGEEDCNDDDAKPYNSLDIYNKCLQQQ